ncbi:MAG: hypothetical protein P8106_02880 [Gammaproteobacteria bacterium]
MQNKRKGDVLGLRPMAGVAVIAAVLASGAVYAESAAELEQRVRQLEQELAAARAELEQANETIADAGEPAPSDIEFSGEGFGTLKIGGAMRANYAIGDYVSNTDGGPSRAFDDGGNFELDTFRVNADYTNGPWVGKLEYRWYDGYNFLHTGWLGFNFEDDSQIQVGVNRVPFGPGPYGVSQSWFFDQHYYVGFADDMDLGVKYTKPFGDWTFDFAYYYSDEGSYAGNSKDSARYSYDVVNESGTGYEERNQFNVRGRYTLPDVPIDTTLGFSAQYGQLKSKGPEDDGDNYAASVHMVNKWNNFTLASQLTYYEYDVDATPLTGSDDLVLMGAFDFAWPVAAEAWIPAVSLSYYKPTPGIAWLDYVIPYVEYSSIVKDVDAFNDSQMWVLGAAWGHGGWYIYTDFAYSNGNYFVGNEGDDYGVSCVGDFGVNCNDDWNSRFNVNFGYYF